MMNNPDHLTGFHQQLRSYVAKRIDRNFVDDVVGDILLRVTEHRDNFDQAENPLAWLYRIAQNIITDHYRRQGVEQKALQQVRYLSDDIDDNDAPDNHTELAACMTPLIQQLPDDYREALMLTDIWGMKQATAATQLGLSVSGMKSRIQRGRHQLKQALRRCCEIKTNHSGQILDYTQKSDTSCGDKCK